MAGGSGFPARDLELAASFGAAAGEAGVGRLVYLGALGAGPLSEHLASRQEVGAALGATGIPVVELRAAVVIGSGSASFEMLRYLTERLPFMVCPRWVRTRVQPIAESDLLDRLTEGLVLPAGIHEIAGDEVTTYWDMIQAYARARGLRRRAIVDVPLLTPRLSAYWVDLVTPVDRSVTHALIDSLVTDVVLQSSSPVGVVVAAVGRGSHRGGAGQPARRDNCHPARAGRAAAGRCVHKGRERRRRLHRTRDGPQ